MAGKNEEKMKSKWRKWNKGTTKYFKQRKKRREKKIEENEEEPSGEEKRGQDGEQKSS